LEVTGECRGGALSKECAGVSKIKKKQRIFIRLFPSGFQGISFNFGHFGDPSIKEAQIGTSSHKIRGQGMATAHFSGQ
jgi:hypothetical protein